MKEPTSSTSQGFPVAFQQAGRLPAPGDNVAIAGSKLAAGTEIRYDQETSFRLNFTILEGHRFAVQPIAEGEPLLSWGLPFGTATRDISPGEYVCNDLMIDALRGRQIDFPIPDQPNFSDQMVPYILDEETFQPGTATPLFQEPGSFMGYQRSAARGVGTRNVILILGLTSHTASYARLLESRLAGTADGHENIDGIIAISHTEGGAGQPLNNRMLLMRTLAGWMVHANVGAVLAVEDDAGQISGQALKQFMVEEEYPLADVPHRFLRLSGDLETDLAAGASIISGWLAAVNETARTPQPLSQLKLALQCGGSDAFSGVSGNPLAAAVAREIVGRGGIANLAETDELIGAEPYLLANVRDAETAQKFLDIMVRFKERLSWHGVTAEGNPSGGNRFRGLYNVVLKSIGAAMKRHPEVRLDYVAEYAEPMKQPGFYFMDSPGNDLESIAGQVAGGSTLILFVTGNGSITNFPLVPTIKIMTTSGRFRMLEKDMDINAGAYQDGTPMADLTAAAVEYTVKVASGQPSAGERAGHAQVSIWRDWPQRDGSQLAPLLARARPSGKPIAIERDGELAGKGIYQRIGRDGRMVSDQVGLILPSSLCASQIARMAANRLNQLKLGMPNQISRFVTLPHTEGCGFSVQRDSDVYGRTMISYMTHPMVKFGLFLEHGCEKTVNDYMRRLLAQRGYDPNDYGWASIQMDGGIEPALAKMHEWFQGKLAADTSQVYASAGLKDLSLGLASAGPVPDDAAQTMAQISRAVVGAGGTVIVPQSAPILHSAVYQQGTFKNGLPEASLAYGQAAESPGFHVMETASPHWVESLTGLGAAGASVMLAYVDGQPRQAHPLVPLLQVTVDKAGGAVQSDFDWILRDDPYQWAEQLLNRVRQVVSGNYSPRMLAQGNVDFQISRGLLGIST